MEASRTPETAQPGAALDSVSTAASLSGRARLRSINDGITWRSRERSRLDAPSGCERRHLGRAEAFAIGLVENEQRRGQPSSSLVQGQEFPDAQPVVARNGRFVVVGERPLPRLVAREGRPEAEARSRRVLVVDDDAGTRKLCSVILELAALEVIEAADGRAGLVRARLQRPDLIVTDVMMPGLDGFQLVEALRQEERTRSIPVIFLSGEPEPGNHARAFALGAAAYVTKPFNPVSFASLVARLLSRAAPPRSEARKPGAGPRNRPLRIATEVLDFGSYND